MAGNTYVNKPTAPAPTSAGQVSGGDGFTYFIENGTVHHVPNSEAASYHEQTNFTPITKSDAESAIAAQTLPEQSGLEQLGQGLASFNEAATGGMSDIQQSAIARVLGGDAASKDYVRRRDEYKAAHPGQNFASQAVAYVAPALVTGGLSALGQGAAKGVIGSVLGEAGGEATGSLLERLAGGRVAQGIAKYGTSGGLTGALGEGASDAITSRLGGGLVSRTLGAVAQGATEGAVIGSLDSASQAMVHDTPLTWEHVASSAGYGALGGGIFGGALHLGGAAVGGLGRSISKEGGLAERSVARNLGITEESKIANIAGGRKAVLENLDGVLQKAGKSIADSPAERLAAFDAAVPMAKDAQYSALRAIDASGKAKPSFGIQQEVREAVVEAMSNRGMVGHRVAEQIERDMVARASNIKSFEALNKEILGMDAQIPAKAWEKFQANGNKVTGMPSVTAAKIIQREAAYNHLLNKLDEAAKTFPEDLAAPVKQFRESKVMLASLAEGQQGLRQLIAKGKANPLFNMQNITGAGVGLLTGHVGITAAIVGSKVAGSMLGAPAGRAAMSAIYRSQVASKLASTASKESLNMSKAVSGFFNDTKKAGARVASKHSADKVTRESYQDKYDTALHLSSPVQAQNIAKESARLAEMYPGLARAHSDGYQRAVQYLAASRPPNNMAMESLVAAPKAAGLSMAEHEYYQKLSVVMQPKQVVSHLADGTITSAEVDAIKAVYPAIYKELTSTVQTHIAAQRASGKPMPYNKVIQLGILLGQPMDPTQEPDMVRAFQDSYAPPPDKGGRPKGSTSSSDTDTASETKTEQLEK